MKSSKNIAAKSSYFFLLCALTFFSFNSFAQVNQSNQVPQQQEVKTNFEDTELKEFADTYKEIVVIQQDGEIKMLQAIEEQNLEIDRFNEILQERQAKPANEIEATEDELASFNKAAEQIMQLQKDTQVEIEEKIEDNIGLEKYQQILIAYQQDEDVQNKIKEYLTEEQPEEEQEK